VTGWGEDTASVAVRTGAVVGLGGGAVSLGVTATGVSVAGDNVGKSVAGTRVERGGSVETENEQAVRIRNSNNGAIRNFILLSFLCVYSPMVQPHHAEQYHC
jgi:hypothetical protein